MLCFFSYHDPATPEIYTLSLHDALPIAPMAPTPTMPPMPSASARRAATERRSRTGRYSDARTGRARTAAATFRNRQSPARVAGGPTASLAVRPWGAGAPLVAGTLSLARKPAQTAGRTIRRPDVQATSAP